ncbi:MAG TPA: hypothetical protein VEG30_06635 [Terriglobales bacterium]|nr:hypothetical protein [Terriglobales bacterium]
MRHGTACLLIFAQTFFALPQATGQDTDTSSKSAPSSPSPLPSQAPPSQSPANANQETGPRTSQENGSAVLYSTGSVQVNHTPVSEVSLVFPGEMVQTDADGSARITAAGSMLLLSADTALTFQKSKPELAFGMAQITTSSGLSLLIREITVSPARPPAAKYDVSSKGDEIRITAHEEALRVTEGDCSQVVQPGTTLIINKTLHTNGKCVVAGKGSNARYIIAGAAAAGAIGAGMAAGGGGKPKQDAASPVQP